MPPARLRRPVGGIAHEGPLFCPPLKPPATAKWSHPCGFPVESFCLRHLHHHVRAWFLLHRLFRLRNLLRRRLHENPVFCPTFKPPTTAAIPDKGCVPFVRFGCGQTLLFLRRILAHSRLLRYSLFRLRQPPHRFRRRAFLFRSWRREGRGDDKPPIASGGHAVRARQALATDKLKTVRTYTDVHTSISARGCVLPNRCSSNRSSTNNTGNSSGCDNPFGLAVVYYISETCT